MGSLPVSYDHVAGHLKIHVEYFRSNYFSGLKNSSSDSDDDKMNDASMVEEANPDGQLNFSSLGQLADLSMMTMQRWTTQFFQLRSIF